MRSGIESRMAFTRGILVSGVLAASLFAPAVFGGAGEAHAFSAASVYRSAASSVVLIFGFDDAGARSSGTGSILTPDGLILTNNHVIVDGDSGRLLPNLVVYFKPRPISGDNRRDLKTPYLVDVVARDPDLDLALLRVQGAPAGLRPISVGDSEEVEIGESVAAIGHPGGGGLWTLTTGTVSSKRRDRSRDIFQTDAAINPGNSGGPLLDEHARLVGVNTFVRRVNDQGLPLEGLNYSLRSSLALRWINQQGIVRIASIPRTPVPASEPAPPPPVPQAPGPPEHEPARPLPDATADRPSAPIVRADSPPPPPEPQAREFSGPAGESMFGVPNQQSDLHDVLDHVREGYEELTKRADDSIDEMNQLLDDYDNF